MTETTPPALPAAAKPKKKKGCFIWVAVITILLVIGLIESAKTQKDWDTNREQRLAEFTELLEREEFEALDRKSAAYSAIDDPELAKLRKAARDGIQAERKAAAEARREEARLAQEKRKAEAAAKQEAARIAEEERLAALTPEERAAEESSKLLAKVTKALHAKLGTGGLFTAAKDRRWQDLQSVELIDKLHDDGSQPTYAHVTYNDTLGSLSSVSSTTADIYEALSSIKGLDGVTVFAMVKVVDLKGQESWTKGAHFELDTKTAREVNWDNVYGDRTFELFETYGRVYRSRFVN